MATKPKQRIITRDTLDALAQSVERDYEAEMAHILKARQAIGGNTSARRQQLDYAEVVQYNQHLGAMGIINRLRALAIDDDAQAMSAYPADRELP